MGTFFRHLGLCLWKSRKLSARQPVTTLLQYLLPSALIGILLLVKLMMPPSEFKTCQFRARTGPSAGPLSMLQSFGCNLKNDCHEMKDFQDIPTYPGSKVDMLVQHLEPVIYNDTVQQFSTNIPNMLKLINGTSEILNETLIMTNFVNRNSTVSEMFYNETKLIDTLKDKGFDDANANGLAFSTLRMGMIIGDLAVIDIKNKLLNCSTITFKLFLPSASRDLIKELQKYVCSSPKNASLFVEAIQNNTNFNLVYEQLQSKNIDDTSKIGASLRDGLNFVNELSFIMNGNKTTSVTRKKRFIPFVYEIDALTESMRDIGNTLEMIQDKIGDDSIMCALKSSNANILEKMKVCNMSYLIEPFSSMIKEQMPIWKPVLEVVAREESDNFDGRCKVDVNRYHYLAMQSYIYEEIPLKYDLSSMFNCSKSRKRQTIASLDSMFNALDYNYILNNIYTWRNVEYNSMNWTQDVQDRIGRITEHVIEIASMADVIKVLTVNSTAVINDPTLLDGMILSQAAVLVEKVSLILDDAEYFLKNTQMWDNFTKVYDTLEVIKEDLQSTTMRVKDFSSNWTNIQNFLQNQAKIPINLLDELYDSVFTLDGIKLAGSLFYDQKPDLCNATYLQRYLLLNRTSVTNGVTFESLSNMLCGSIDIIPSLAENLKMKDILQIITEASNFSPENFGKVSNVTSTELEETVESIGQFSEIYDELEISMNKLIDALNFTNIKESLNVTKLDKSHFPAIISNFLCGTNIEKAPEIKHKPLIPLNTTEESFELLDNECAPIFSALSKSASGTVVWRYLHPILMGNIYLVPDNGMVKQIMKVAQRFFDKVEGFRSRVLNISEQYKHLQNLESYRNQSIVITNLTHSYFFRDFIKSKAGLYYNIEGAQPVNLTYYLESLLNIDDMMGLASNALSALKCMNNDRFKLFPNEREALKQAMNNTKANFLAIANFGSGQNESRVKRSANEKLPKHIEYKIRMSYDSVPITSALKERLWVPGPEGDFFYNMRYFWGFTQIQDLIDNAIIELQSGSKPNDIVQLQQFPYPCFMRDNFLSGLYTAQILQVGLIFGFSILVSTFVREFIWERESKNGQLLEVMGMKFTTVWISNFLIMLQVFNINSLILSLLLYFGGLLPRTEFGITYLTLFVFSLSCMSFIFMMTVLLTKPSSGSVVSFLLFIVFLLPFIFIISMNEDVDDAIKVVSGMFLSSSFGFTFLYITRYEQQQQGLQWNYVTESPIDDDSFSYLHFLLLMLADTLLYLFIGVVITKMSRIDGSWTSSKKKSDISSTLEDEIIEGIVVKSLKKEFKMGKKTRIAVADLSISFKKGEITGLLGHNGAGKSTTMSMLIGMVEPDRGVIIYDGKKFDCLMDTHRSMVGYCSQHGILYDNMTIEEHLHLYATLKSSENSKVKEYINTLITKMDLEDKRDFKAKNLSEGLKRRLAICIAFSGKDSCVIILDEPTAGVDSLARRKIWEFITDNKENKTIIISTHHMDEAEILCDNIAIMHRGSILSMDSTMQLKEKYGHSLQLNISQGLSSEAPTKVTSVCSSRLSMETPQSPGSDALDFHVTRIVPAARKLTHSAHRRSYALPVEESTGFTSYQELFALLENEKEFLDINTFSIASANLEDVFLSLTDDADSMSEENIKTNDAQKRNQIADINKESDAGSLNGLESDFVFNDKTETSTVRALMALVTKRAKRFLKDRRMLMTSLLLPVLMLTLSMVLGIVRPKTTLPTLLLTPSMYGPESYSFLTNLNSSNSKAFIVSPGIGTTCTTNFSSASKYVSCNNYVNQEHEYNVKSSCECKSNNWDCSKKESLVLKQSLRNTTDVVNFLSDEVTPNRWILDTHYDLVKHQYGGWHILNDTQKIVYFNNKGFHSSAAYLNAMNNARLRSRISQTSDPRDYGITAYSEPIKLTKSDILRQSILQYVADYTLALFMLASISFVPSSTIIYLIEERLNEERLVLQSFKVGPILYTMASFIWDFIISSIFTIIAGIIIFIFNINAFTAGLNLIATLLLILMYCLTISTFSYLLQRMFGEPSYGQVVIFTCCIFIGVVTLMVMLLTFMYWWIRAMIDARKVLVTALLILPPYALGGGLLDLVTNQLTNDLMNEYTNQSNDDTNPFTWNLIGKNLTFMAAEIILFLLITVVYEIITQESTSQDSTLKEILKIKSVSKEYTQGFTKHTAVSDVDINVQRGECFGLIGLNGAGKSTIFKMITGSLQPTYGNIVFGCERIGYCPQSNSLDEHLSVNSHLDIYAQIAGYDSTEAKAVTTYLMKEFALEQYRGVPCGNLSGGNKRKVCTATAMLGRPDLILLDEPTSGMDPATRRIVWKMIGSCAKRGQSLVLTSHSLVECDILCDQIAIMVKGQILCKESPGALRDMYGSGYKINLKIGADSSEQKVNDYVTESFANTKFIEHKYSWLKYRVGGKISSILTLLDIAKTQGLVESFTIDVASLEDIFLQITQNQEGDA